MGQLVRGAPGVYLQGLPSESVSLQTAVTGFVGIAGRGPLHVPQPIRTWDEFELVFGGFIDYGVLPHEVFGFFKNQGSRCIVVRVGDPTLPRGELPTGTCPREDFLKAADSSALPILDANGAPTMLLSAINQGSWGNRIHFEIRLGSQLHMPLTTVAADAAVAATTITVNEPFDLAANMSIRLALPGDPSGGQIATVLSVTAAGVVTLTAPLARDVPRGTVVLGRGFKVVARFDGRAEVFDNLSMAPTHSRYFGTTINAPDESLSYIERQARGHSILIRATHLFAGTVSRFRPVERIPPAPPLPDPNVLTGGGDGFRFSEGAFKDAAAAPSIRVVARATAANRDSFGHKGNGIRVKADPFATRTGLASAVGATGLVLESVSGLVIGDAIVVTGGGNTETRTVTGIGPDNGVSFTGGLANPYPLGSTVSVVDRFTLRVYRDAPPTVTTTLAVAASAGATSVVVDNAAEITGGTLTVATLTGTTAEAYPIVSVTAGSNVITLNTAGLSQNYPLGSLVTVVPPTAIRSREPKEIHFNLSGNPASARYFRPRLVADSTLLCGNGPSVLVQPPVGEVTLAAGRDPGTIDFRWYTGYELNGQLFAPASVDSRCGLATLELLDEIDLVALPELVAQALLPAPAGPAGPHGLYLVPIRQVLQHAARLGDRMALLDLRRGTTIEQAIQLPRQIADPGTGGYGALYYPWVTAVSDATRRVVPPSGFVAGIVARADRSGGVVRAPANFTLKDVVDVEQPLEADHQDALNPAGVNAIRKFELPALELWGARTLSTDPAARFVSVRRVVIALKKALLRRLLWVAFEPNGPALRRRIQAALQSLLETLVAGGATAASDNAFFVQCDDENNPPEAVARGEVVATIGLAVASPAEFIVLKVKRTPDAVSVAEEAV